MKTFFLTIFQFLAILMAILLIITKSPKAAGGEVVILFVCLLIANVIKEMK